MRSPHADGPSEPAAHAPVASRVPGGDDAPGDPRGEAASALPDQAVEALFALVEGLNEAPGAELTARARARPEEVFAELASMILRLIVLLYAEARGQLGAPDSRPLCAWILSRGTADEEPASLILAIEARLAARSFASPGAQGEGARLFDPACGLFAAHLSEVAAERVLRALITYNEEPIPYATMPLEAIGSAYEALLGLGITVTSGASLRRGARGALVDLDAVIARSPEARGAALAEAGITNLGARALRIAVGARSAAELAAALGVAGREPAALIPAGVAALAPTLARRRSGSHYTPPRLTRAIVAAALAPLLRERPSPEQILALRVCDPAMGSGAFLLEACRALADALLAARGASTADPEARARARFEVASQCLRGVDRDPVAVEICRASLWLLTRAEAPIGAFLARELRAGDSLIGASREDLEAFPALASPASKRRAAVPDAGAIPGERDPSRAEIDPSERRPARAAVPAPRTKEEIAALNRRLDAWTALWFWPADGEKGSLSRPTEASFEGYLFAAEADDPCDPRARIAAAIARRASFLHWETAFPDVFARERGEPPGFDVIVGNPPWIAYAGRAAQPLAEAVFRFYLARSPAFFGYRTLHGLFIHRAATLLRPGGRLGLVVPTSVADLQGYAPARAAHDRLCAPDAELPDFGDDAFAGVFQPAMGLLSTRRPDTSPIVATVAPIASPAWRLQRDDLDREAYRLCERLSALRPLPAALFGERGYQTIRADAPRLRSIGAPEAPHTVPLREGRDIGPFVRRPARLHFDPRGSASRLRSEEDWREVKLFIRQTARYPIAALGDGQPFRNSVLAGFASEEHSAFFLLCYLNSAPIRWFHFTRYRDARQGMPQVKIAHLRGLPAPPASGPEAATICAELEVIGRAVGERNQGIEAELAAIIDGLVARALLLTEAELTLVRAWAAENPPPRSISG